jgi:hypothetical protein
VLTFLFTETIKKVKKMNLYEKSWSIYKAHSESFEDDFDYYLNFTRGYRSLEAFAGYGRVGNFLSSRGVDLSINELSSDFIKYLRIPPGKIHIGNILDFQSATKFERIFAAYNSFCLIREDADIRKLFSVFEKSLMPYGQLSLSYYHPNYWDLAIPYTFEHEGQSVKYSPSFDLSGRKDQVGIWRDVYKVGEEEFEHKYQVRIYESKEDVEKMLTHTKLRLVKEVLNYNNPSIMEPGWIEYVFELLP